MIHYTCPPVVWASIYNTPLAHSFLPPRSALPHGSLRLVGGPSPQSGVVLLSWCGYSGTLSMQPTQHLETDLRGGGLAAVRRPAAAANETAARVVNELRAAAVCSALGFQYSRCVAVISNDHNSHGLLAGAGLTHRTSTWL